MVKTVSAARAVTSTGVWYASFCQVAAHGSPQTTQRVTEGRVTVISRRELSPQEPPKNFLTSELLLRDKSTRQPEAIKTLFPPLSDTFLDTFLLYSFCISSILLVRIAYLTFRATPGLRG